MCLRSSSMASRRWRRGSVIRTPRAATGGRSPRGRWRPHVRISSRGSFSRTHRRRALCHFFHNSVIFLLSNPPRPGTSSAPTMMKMIYACRAPARAACRHGGGVGCRFRRAARSRVFSAGARCRRLLRRVASKEVDAKGLADPGSPRSFDPLASGKFHELTLFRDGVGRGGRRVTHRINKALALRKAQQLTKTLLSHTPRQPPTAAPSIPFTS